MSPEQVRKPKTVDTRSDIWSLGVILHELLSGAPPFLSDTPLSILAAVVTDPAPLVRSMRDDVPEGLQAVILKCLEKEPARRYADITELAHALKPFTPMNGAAAVARISAIARSAKERAITGSERVHPTSDIPTLESRGPLQDTPTLESPRVSVQDQLKQTDAGWGHSKTVAGRSRRRVAAAVVVAIATFAVLWMGWRWFAASPLSAAGDRGVSTSAADVAVLATPAAAVTTVPPPAIAPPSNVDAEPIRAEAARDAEAIAQPGPAKAAALAPKRATKGAGGAGAAEKPSPARPAPGNDPSDPLEGRR
jgi:serine/threonine-protein kinase